MPLQIFNGKLVMRDGKLAAASECCTCCACDDTGNLPLVPEECAIDYIAVELDFCLPACEIEPGVTGRDCSGEATCDGLSAPDKCSVTLTVSEADGWIKSFGFDPAGFGELEPNDNENNLGVNIALGCSDGEFAIGIGFDGSPTGCSFDFVPGGLCYGLFANGDRANFSSFDIQPLDLAMKKVGEACCPDLAETCLVVDEITRTEPRYFPVYVVVKNVSIVYL